ncbi:hypothetical protein [Poriferisphaera sp. WC338]|uniref:hypothetical protein n=1 Tax=Poriferisphaera sp. WC338 TaxID=3425129 RepID=UPI003D817FC9
MRNNILMTAVLVSLTVLLQGCAGFGWIAEQIHGKKIPALYEIKPKPTLIMVDDPDRLLPSGNLAQVIAANVAHNLTFQEELEDMYIVPQRDLIKLQTDLGKEYLRQPIDKIGSRLGANQVIYINIKAFQTRYAGQVYRPTATAEIKLIETKTGHRLFPTNAKRVIDTTLTPPGHMVTVKTFYQREDLDGTGTQQVHERRIAEELGQKIAEIFYNHAEPEPGETLPG